MSLYNYHVNLNSSLLRTVTQHLDRNSRKGPELSAALTVESLWGYLFQ